MNFDDIEKTEDKRTKEPKKIAFSVAAIILFSIVMLNAPASYSKKTKQHAKTQPPTAEAPSKELKSLNQPRSALMLPPDISIQPDPKKWALIIGIEKYARLPEVLYARNDASVVRDYFIRILGVPESQVMFLIDHNATKARIDACLTADIPNNVNKDADLYVYFVGHGMPDLKKDEPYLIPYDADVRYIERTGYRLSSFYQDLYQLDIRSVIVFLDCCFSGVTSCGSMGEKTTRAPLMQFENAGPRSGAIISFNATSEEQINNPFPEKRHGLFTYYLLRGLKGEADKNNDLWIDMFELYQYTRDHVVRESRRMESVQIPIVVSLSDRWKDIKVCPNRK